MRPMLTHVRCLPKTSLTEIDTNEQPLLIQCRDIYGQGTVATIAYLEADGRPQVNTDQR